MDKNVNHFDFNPDQLQAQGTLLGEGLSGHVYAWEKYAVKVFKEDANETQDAWYLDYFQDHQAFPTLHHATERLMVVERIHGHTLAELRKSQNQLPAIYLEQVEQILTDCYQHGIIAQDLHLNNLMIDEQNQVKVIDVGRFFYTTQQQNYMEELDEQLENLSYYCGFFGSSKKRKRKKYRKYSSSKRSRYRSSSSSSSSGRRRRRKKYKSSSS